MKSLRFLLVLISLLACTRGNTEAEGTELRGQVTRVIDGDTLELTVAPDRLVRIRLAQIDAPETAQPYGEQATAALSRLALGERVRVEVVDIDRYGRTVGEIYLLDPLDQADRNEGGGADLAASLPPGPWGRWRGGGARWVPASFPRLP